MGEAVEFLWSLVGRVEAASNVLAATRPFYAIQSAHQKSLTTALVFFQQ